MIKNKRKYQYEYLYTVQGLYFGRWEDETTEETFRDAKLRAAEYRKNMPEYAHRIKQEVTKTLLSEVKP